MYLNPPINGQYELHEPIETNTSKWYVRTFDYQFNTAGHIGPPNRYAYLNRDLSFAMYPHQDFYDSKEEALDIMRLYYVKCNQISAQQQEKVYKLLEPRLSIDKTDKWLVPTTESHRYLFSNGKIDRYLLVSDPLAYFPSYQSALFAKLRYERLNREK